MRRSGPAVLAAVCLFAVYTLTLAPDVTFWDAGEFIAASRSLGIPHPPGTPLFVLLANVWAKILPFAWPVSTNLLSAAATALAAGVSARLVHRATGSAPVAVAAALVAGGMSTAWSNATETEVYAASLALGMLAVLAAERAGATGEARWTVVTAYLISLAVPLHLSALVTAPAGIWLASSRSDGWQWRPAALLTGALLMTIGAGRVSPWFVLAGLLLIATTLRVHADADAPSRRLAARALLPLAVIGVVFAGCSAVLFMRIRAGADPFINQGDPDTWQRLANVVARRQYAVAPIWPRMAAPWVQLANIGQYADWQIALSTGPTVLPSLLRTLATALFVFLAFVGGAWHWRVDRRTAAAFAILFASGTLGVMVYLNLHPGPSMGFPGLAVDAAREARERDYFYVFGFWAWGLWAGIGAVHVVRQWSRPATAGILLASVPLVLNWRAVSRRGDAEAMVPRRWAEALLESTPQNGVLFVSGDNDTYPLWYSQAVNGVRPDVAIITIPLLATRWYRNEIASRRNLALASANDVQSRSSAAIAIADDARRQGRAVVASPTLYPDERERLAPAWKATGLVFVAGDTGIDAASAESLAARIAEQLPDARPRDAIDPVTAYFRRLMECPRQLAEFARTRDSTRLDSTCNYR